MQLPERVRGALLREDSATTGAKEAEGVTILEGVATAGTDEAKARHLEDAALVVARRAMMTSTLSSTTGMVEQSLGMVSLDRDGGALAAIYIG